MPGTVGTAVRLRPYRGAADHPAMADVSNAASGFAGAAHRMTAEVYDVDYAHLTNSDAERDVRIAELDDKVVGYGRIAWADRTSGERAFDTICHIRPEARGRGAGSALLAFQLERADSLLAGMTDVAGRAVIVAAYVFTRDEHGIRLLTRNGFEVVRRHAELVRRDLHAVPRIPMPDGLEIRPIDPGDEAAVRRAFDVDTEVFRDHWGDVDGSDAAWERFKASRDIQPELWQVAFDRTTGDVAGQILNYLATGEDGDTIGWTESIAVRRPYRRRGLARALLAASLERVRAAGATSAALDVDTENANHALDLYESLGFHVIAEQLEFHRVVVR
jgi:mycothiol synthase